MIPVNQLAAFSREISKIASAAKMSNKMKAALGLTAATGIGVGAVGEQAKDDLLAGRFQRRQEARMQGRKTWAT